MEKKSETGPATETTILKRFQGKIDKEQSSSPMVRVWNVIAGKRWMRLLQVANNVTMEEVEHYRSINDLLAHANLSVATFPLALEATGNCIEILEEYPGVNLAESEPKKKDRCMLLSVLEAGGKLLSALKGKLYHGNISPYSVFVKYSKVKFADVCFGQHTIDGCVPKDRTLLVLHPEYRAPEVSLHKTEFAFKLVSSIDAAKADIYSLGLTVLQLALGPDLVLGQEPGMEIRSKSSARWTEDPVFNSLPEIRNLLLRMLDSDPSKRFTPQELLTVLTKMSQDTSGLAIWTKAREVLEKVDALPQRLTSVLYNASLCSDTALVYLCSNCDGPMFMLKTELTRYTLHKIYLSDPEYGKAYISLFERAEAIASARGPIVSPITYSLSEEGTVFEWLEDYSGSAPELDSKDPKLLREVALQALENGLQLLATAGRDIFMGQINRQSLVYSNKRLKWGTFRLATLLDNSAGIVQANTKIRHHDPFTAAPEVLDFVHADNTSAKAKAKAFNAKKADLYALAFTILTILWQTDLFEDSALLEARQNEPEDLRRWRTQPQPNPNQDIIDLLLKTCLCVLPEIRADLSDVLQRVREKRLAQENPTQTSVSSEGKVQPGAGSPSPRPKTESDEIVYLKSEGHTIRRIKRGSETGTVMEVLCETIIGAENHSRLSPALWADLAALCPHASIEVERPKKAKELVAYTKADMHSLRELQQGDTATACVELVQKVLKVFTNCLQLFVSIQNLAINGKKYECKDLSENTIFVDPEGRVLVLGLSTFQARENDQDKVTAPVTKDPYELEALKPMVYKLAQAFVVYCSTKSATVANEIENLRHGNAYLDSWSHFGRDAGAIKDCLLSMLNPDVNARPDFKGVETQLPLLSCSSVSRSLLCSIQYSNCN